MRGLSKRDGTWIASWRYNIYGAVIDSAGSAPFPVRYRWTGREYDAETGLYFFRSRFYDAAAQRFVQEDPIGFAGGANLYAYGDGNPTNGRDPSGLKMDAMMYAPDGMFGGRPMRGGGAGVIAGFGRFADGGFGDWNADGMDDHMEFEEYSWGKQNWINAHGSIDDWHQVWDAVMALPAATRDNLIARNRFGDILPIRNASLMGEADNPGNPHPHAIRINIDKMLEDGKLNLFDVMLTIVHELYHQQMMERFEWKPCPAVVNPPCGPGTRDPDRAPGMGFTFSALEVIGNENFADCLAIRVVGARTENFKCGKEP